MAIAKKKAPRKPKLAPLAAPAPIQAPMPAEPKKANLAGRARLVLWVVVIVFVAWKMLPSCKTGAPSAPNATIQAPAAAQPAPFKPGFNSVEKLNRISRFETPKIIADLKALDNGDVYVLHTDELALYRGGKQVKSLALAGAPNRSMAFDGSSFYVTNSDNHGIERIGKNLVSKGTIQLPDASRLLGITWLAGRQALAVAEVGARTLYLVTPAGKVLKTASTSKDKADLDGFAYDAQTLPDGGVILSNMYNGEAKLFGSDLKLKKTLTELCGAKNNRRVGVIKGRLYMPCASNKAVLIMAVDGKPMGHLEVAGPSVAHGGADGALYVTDEREVLKYKL